MNEAACLAKFNARQGPRIGDYIVMLDGVCQRIACNWGHEIQTGHDATWHFVTDKGYMVFNGRLDLILPRGKVAPTIESLPAPCWFGDDQIMVDCRVWREKGARQVIELFGPSGSGKTTVADALLLQLQRDAYVVRTMINRRDNLLFRSLNRSVQALHSCASNSPQALLATELLKLLPPHNAMWALRLRGYLAQLWERSNATAADDVALLDQGFIQFVCSLALLAGVDDRMRITEALDLIPRPDLVVRVDAPLDVIETRLHERRRKLNSAQRWLELDLRTNGEQMRIIQTITEILTSQRQGLITVNCPNGDSCAPAVEKIITEIKARSQSCGLPNTIPK